MISRRLIVLADASVLINFALAGLLEKLGALKEFSFAVPENVLAEIIDPIQRSLVEQAIDNSILALARVEGAALQRFVELAEVMGSGESACLALAEESDDSLVASDERRLFLRTTEKLLGPGRIVTTPDLMVRLIRAGSLSVDGADEAKQLLEQKRFKMRFGSFRELVGND